MAHSEEELVPASDIAVIGMACRFPGAKNPAEYWRNLRDGVESVRFMTDEELAAAGVDPAVIANTDYVKASIVLEEMEMFDAGFFGFSPKDAAIMDPQHRHFLECSWEALENAGHNPDTFPGSIGVYGGCGMGAYFMYNCLTNRQLMESTGLFLVRHTGNDKDFLTTRVSYQFNLRGPSVNVQTACSTSLVAIHLACQNLLNGECDMALAGGVTIELPHYRGYMYQDGEILSRDGHCRAFDHRSTGTIFGSGAGVVALRRLEDALRDGDTIHAVIKGSAINNDGSQKVGYLAPSVDGQAAAISEALNVAGFTADTVTYIETHGTGTAVGDPIEVTALTDAFRRTTDKKGFCGIGSVKTNIGHLDTAAGVASFIKAVQALRHKQLPPSLHFEKPNPLIDFASSPFYVNASLQDWTPPAGVPRRAGVSSLGVGGTNAHVVIEEAPEAETSAPSPRPFELLTLSARTESALDRATRNLAAHFRAEPGTNLADAAYTLAVGRKPFRYRRVLAARDLEDAAQALETADTKRIFTHQAAQSAPSIVFLFPGGGAQYPQMGRGLYEREEVYRRHADECLAIVKPQIDVDLKRLMFPPEDELDAAAAQLERPLYSILSIFITEYALAKLWMSWGVMPAAMTGHSLGEYTAACLAGVISLEEAISLVTARGKIFERMPAGGMLSVQAPESDIRKLLTARMSIAAANAPATCVVSGEDAALDELAKTLAGREIDCARLKISVAAHSPMLDPFLDEFAAHAKEFTLRPPSIQYVSNLTGNWIKPEDLDATYWVRHLRNTVRFADGLAVLLEDPNRILLEVGPGTTLSSLVRQQPGKKPAHTVLNSLRHPKEAGSDAQYFLSTFGRLWAAGVPVDWTRLYGAEKRRRIPLPSYSFDHQRYWIEPGKAVYATASAGETAAPAKLTRASNVNDWFYRPEWKKAPLADTSTPATRRCWLIFRDGEGLGAEIADQLHSMGQDVITVDRGAHFQGLSETHYTLNPGDRMQYDSLVSALIENGRIPQKVLYLWTVARDAAADPLASLDAQLDASFFGLLFFTQALAGEDLVDSLDITIVATGIRQVENQPETLAPERATLLGPCLVIPQEFPGVTCRAVDVVLPRAGSGSLAWQIIAEAAGAAPVERIIAYRGETRWVETWAPSPIEAGEPLPSRLRRRGVYLITGGLGDIALIQADMLARKWQARLALVSRTGLPARDQWGRWLETHSPDDFTARRIRQVQALEAQGSEVLVLRADVTDLAQFRAAVNETAAQFGAVHGVIHTAGVINDGVIQEKTRREAEQVLAPKVRGTLVIEEALRGHNPDFVLLFSSTSALLGLAGQVDYTAANAFLDAWAQARSGRNAPYTVSVDWGVWQGVGMAASAVRQRDAAQGPARAMDHPLLGRCTVDSPSLVAYEADYRVDGMWVLSEHKLKGGECLLPGTGFLELAKAALEKGSPAAVEIRDLFFLAPLEVKADSTCAVGITLKKEGGAFGLSVTSRTPAGEMEHARAEVSFLHAAEAPRTPVDAIAARCAARIMRPEPGRPQTKQEEHLDFGPRWKNLVEMRFGRGEALALLELPEENVSDLAAWTLHPAVMDQATCFALPLLRDYERCNDLFVPLSYKRVRAYAPLPRRVWSHAQLKRDDHEAHGVAVFDVRILDETGSVVVEVEEFAVRRLTEKVSGATMGTFRPAAAAGAGQPSDAQSRLQAWVQDGIRAQEGADALERILLRGGGSQFAASPLALPALIEQTRPRAKTARSSDAPAVEGADEIETNLLTWWSDLLGVEKVGLNDDFFDLGGQSLVAVRLFTKIKKTYQVDLGLATLFEARTVRQLAEVLRNQGAKGGADSSWSALVPLQKGNGTKPILFCVHGVGGNVLGYNALVRYLPPDQPFYAIQGQGLNRKQTPITKMEEMAAYYVKEIRTVQPHGPYYLSGYSFGGVAAFEMACQLVAAGERVAFLLMFDSDRPNSPVSTATKLRLHAELLWKASPKEKLKHIRRKFQAVMRRLRKAPAKKNVLQQQESSAENFRDVRASNFKAYHGYHSGVYPGKITLFRANKTGESGIRTPDLGWSGKARGGIETHWIPGDHIDILYEPNVPVAARKLAECLERAYAEESARTPQVEVVRR